MKALEQRRTIFHLVIQSSQNLFKSHIQPLTSLFISLIIPIHLRIDLAKLIYPYQIVHDSLFIKKALSRRCSLFIT